MVVYLYKILLKRGYRVIRSGGVVFFIYTRSGCDMILRSGCG